MKQKGSCRIIAGQWRGRKLLFNDAEGLRPTTDRIRETAFNWLQAELAGSTCLDCFAGSGALGFEAASRGAGRVVMLDNNKATISGLLQNRDAFSASMIEVEYVDAIKWLELTLKSEGSLSDIKLFDIVFLDPPYQSELLEKSCALLAQSSLLKPKAKIYLEYALDDTIQFPSTWHCLKSKKAGQVRYNLFVNEPSCS